VRDAIASVSLPVELVARYPDQLSVVNVSASRSPGPSWWVPRLLVCDEVTSALDVSVQAAVVETLRRLQVERSLSLLFITHNLALVRSVAQRVVVMKEGRVVRRGSSTRLDHPQDGYTRALMNDVPRFVALTGP